MGRGVGQQAAYLSCCKTGWLQPPCWQGQRETSSTVGASR